MFKLKNQKEDSRKVVSVKYDMWGNLVLVVKNSDRDFEEVRCGDLHPRSNFDPCCAIEGMGKDSLIESYQLEDSKTDMLLYRLYLEVEKLKNELKTRNFKVNDKVIINRGRKMKGQVKIIKHFWTYSSQNTYGYCDVDYVVFTDGTKVALKHCDAASFKLPKRYYEFAPYY